METKPTLIVMLSRFPYPLEKGDKLRAFHQLKGLSEKYAIHLMCTVENKIEPAHFEHVKAYCTSIHLFHLSKLGLAFQLFLSVFSKKPFQALYFYRFTHQLKIGRLIRDIRPDHIYCQLIRVSEYVKDYHYCNKTIDYMDAFSKGMERRVQTESFFFRWFYRLESKRLALYERSIFDYFENHTIISEQDRSLLIHPNKQQVVVVPNGIDASFFDKTTCAKDTDIVFTGNFSYAPNIDAAVILATKILPALHQKGHKINLLLSGANPSAKVKALANENIIIGGWVDDIRTSYQRSKLFVAPLFIGTGLQNKLLEAMASGLPCISTPLVNQALAAVDGESILLANSPEAIVSKIEWVLEHPELAAKIGENGKTYIQSTYSWTTQNELLSALLQR